MKITQFDLPTIEPQAAIRTFIRTYTANMGSSLQMIVNIIGQAKDTASKKSRSSCLQQAADTVESMKQGLELMRQNILRASIYNRNL